VEGQGRFGGGGLTGAGTEEDDIAVAGNLNVPRGEGVWRKQHRAGEGEGVWEQFEGVTQVHDIDRLAGIELLLQLLGLKACRRQLLEDDAAANEAGHKEADDAENQQRAREAAHPVKQAGIAIDQVAEEAASGQQDADPQGGADAVKEQKLGNAHAVFASNGRRERGQARNEFGNDEGEAATAAKGVLSAAHAGGGLKGELAEDAQHMVAVAAADEEPGCVCHKRRGEA